MFDSPSEILLEVVEPENVAVNEAAVERSLHENLQIAHAQGRNGTLPADPDVALGLWPYLDESIAEEPACHCPIEFTPQGHHREGLVHARSNKFVSVRVQDDVVERVRVAIENRRHDTVTGGRNAVAEDPIDLGAMEF